ncbi:hypothetical protein COO60DRAFT_1482978, partial [Scenedesmus sp. NREL 46B-D3]
MCGSGGVVLLCCSCRGACREAVQHAAVLPFETYLPVLFGDAALLLHVCTRESALSLLQLCVAVGCGVVGHVFRRSLTIRRLWLLFVDIPGMVQLHAVGFLCLYLSCVPGFLGRCCVRSGSRFCGLLVLFHLAGARPSRVYLHVASQAPQVSSTQSFWSSLLGCCAAVADEWCMAWVVTPDCAQAWQGGLKLGVCVRRPPWLHDAAGFQFLACLWFEGLWLLCIGPPWSGVV